MLPLLLAQSALGRAVSFDEPAMPLARLLPALGRAANVEIAAATNVAADVALVKAKDRPLGEILSRIAEQDGAEIETTKTGYRIVRTTASEKRERTAALAQRIASLRSGLDATRESLGQGADVAAYRTVLPALKAQHERDGGGGGWLRSGRPSPQARLPQARAAMRALLLIPVETLADLHEGDRIVYSNRPTRLQKPMAALEPILKTFAREHDAWSKVASGSGVTPGNFADDPFRNTDPLSAPPARAVLIVRRTNSADAAMIQLVVLDAQGNDLARSSYGLQAKEMARAMGELEKPSAEEAVPMAPETRTLIEGTPRFDGTGPENADPAAAALLTEPEKRDPLSFGATDLVRDLAADRPVVAVLPDNAWLAGLIQSGGLKRTDRLFLASLTESQETEGWLLIRPRSPETARHDRVSRAALGRFIRAIVAQKRVPLDAFADYAWTASEAPSDMVGVPMAMMLARGTFNPDVDWQSLRLFGSFPATDRRALESGGKETWATLSPRQRDLAAWVVERHIRSIAHEGAAPRSLALMTEPTEIFAEGYEGLEVRLRVGKDEPLLCDSTTNRQARQWRRVLKPEEAGRAAGLPNGPAFDRFGIARRTTYVLSVSGRKNVNSEESLEDVVPPRGPLGPLSALPTEIRNAVEAGKALAASEKSGGTNRSTTP